VVHFILPLKTQDWLHPRNKHETDRSRSCDKCSVASLKTPFVLRNLLLGGCAGTSFGRDETFHVLDFMILTADFDILELLLVSLRQACGFRPKHMPEAQLKLVAFWGSSWLRIFLISKLFVLLYRLLNGPQTLELEIQD